MGQEAAEAAYDRSAACRFTTFVGYEWSLTPGSVNLHRNVIFRNAVVPSLASVVSSLAAPEIPTLSSTGLGALVLLIAVAGWMAVRRRA